MTREQAVAAAQDIDRRWLAQITSRVERDDRGLHFHHLRWMIGEMIIGMSENKTQRWLGYIQGVLTARGTVTLDEMKDVSKRAAGA